MVRVCFTCIDLLDFKSRLRIHDFTFVPLTRLSGRLEQSLHAHPAQALLEVPGMQLRTKVTLIISAVILFSLGANYAIQHLLIAPSFRSLEESEALADWQRCRQAIDRELQTLDYLCFDWSAWDDTYTYIQDKNPDFFGACLENKDWYLDQEIHVLYFVRPDGTVHFSNIVQNDPANPVKLSLLPPDRLPLDHPLLQVQPDKESFVRGIFLTELGVTMLAARPLLTSENTGPAQGVLIFGRVLNDKALARLADQTGVEFAAIDVRSTSLSAEQRDDIAAALVSDAPFETVHDDGLLTVTGLVRDVAGNPVMALQSRCDRAITAQGAKALNFATASIAVSCAITLGALLIGLQFIMIKPIGELTAHARQVGETGQLSARLEPKGSDEFATLAKAFNRMLDQLAESRAQTVSLSRQAGKAEIAASVMHNIGNALTNVPKRQTNAPPKIQRLGEQSGTRRRGCPIRRPPCAIGRFAGWIRSRPLRWARLRPTGDPRPMDGPQRGAPLVLPIGRVGAKPTDRTRDLIARRPPNLGPWPPKRSLPGYWCRTLLLPGHWGPPSRFPPPTALLNSIPLSQNPWTARRVRRGAFPGLRSGCG